MLCYVMLCYVMYVCMYVYICMYYISSARVKCSLQLHFFGINLLRARALWELFAREKVKA